MSAEDAWTEEVRKKLLSIFDDGSMEGIRSGTLLLLSLDKEARGEKNPTPHWLTLKACLENDRAFEAYARHLMEEMQRNGSDNDVGPANASNEADDDDVDDSNACGVDEDLEPQDVVILTCPKVLSEIRRGYIMESLKKAGMIGVTQALAMMSSDEKAFLTDILSAAPFAADFLLLQYAETLLTSIDESRGKSIVIGLALVSLGCSTFGTMKERREGRISNKVFLSQVFENLFSASGSVIGGFVGAFFGRRSGPLATVLGGVVGATAMCVFGGASTHHLRRYLFPGD